MAVPAGQWRTIHRIGQQGTAIGDVTEPKAALKEYGFGAQSTCPQSAPRNTTSDASAARPA
jgi:hypothetical protein